MNRQPRPARIAIGALCAMGVVAAAAALNYLLFIKSVPMTPPLIVGFAFLVALVASTVTLFVRALFYRPEEALAPPSLELARQLARSGRRIQAVAMVREISGVSLIEASDAVKAMESEQANE